MDTYVTVLQLLLIYQIFKIFKIIKIIIVLMYYISRIKTIFKHVHTTVRNINNKLQKFKIKGYVTKV
jgi:hypothetical protein